MTVGYSDMTRDQIVENVLKTVEQLSQKFPGGPNNIRSLHIKTTSSTAIPFFVSLGMSCSSRQGWIVCYKIMFVSCQYLLTHNEGGANIVMCLWVGKVGEGGVILEIMIYIKISVNILSCVPLSFFLFLPAAF